MNPVLVYGSGMLGQLVRALAADCGRKFSGFIDDFTAGGEIVVVLEDLLARPGLDRCEIALTAGGRRTARQHGNG